MLNTEFSIESMLTTRLFLSPQLSNGKIYFISDMGGAGMSLYSMDAKGKIPQPLLPKGISLQNPYLMAGYLFKVFPNLSCILIMMDKDGNENYQPCLIPLEGGIPKPVFPDLEGNQLICTKTDIERNLAWFNIDNRKTPERETIQIHLGTKEKRSLGSSIYGNLFNTITNDLKQAVVSDGYGFSGNALYLWDRVSGTRKLLQGDPIEERDPEGDYKPLFYFNCHYIANEKEILCLSNRFRDTFSVISFPLIDPKNEREVNVVGIEHEGAFGELDRLHHIHNNLYQLTYNIDGCSFAYEVELQQQDDCYILKVDRTICGLPPLSNGVLQSISEEISDGKLEYVLSFSRATTPPQIFRFGKKYPSGDYLQITNEQILGIPSKFLSLGEDASYTSFDGLRVSARFYMPSPELNFSKPRPLVIWVHGGPTSQERPDFGWFSMPLIQTLTLNGFAVYVPNVRGSTGYGLEYTKKIERDWGGDDRKDHVEGIKALEKDPRIDSRRRGVGGRSYGGFMTLTLITRHPELWSAGVDMFGPYDLPAFMRRLPPTWQTGFKLILGDPDKEDDLKFLVERSPRTYLDQIQCPLLVVQGKNDPRVLEEESNEIVENLRKKGHVVDYLMFPDEGHDVLKFKNKLECFTRIVEFFKTHLSP